MKIAAVILLALLSLPAMATDRSRWDENFKRYWDGTAAKEAPTSPLLKRTQDLGVLWVTGQIGQKEFCQKAEPLRAEIRNNGKTTEPDFKPFIAMWSWCP